VAEDTAKYTKEDTAAYNKKVKFYMKVFAALVVLTVVELIFVEMPKFMPGISQLLVTILVCAASLAKAVLVGWYFMHLNHETGPLRKIIMLSVVTFFYAAVLIPDTIADRPTIKYIPEPPRVFEKEATQEEVQELKTEAVPEAVVPVDGAAMEESSADSEWE